MYRKENTKSSKKKINPGLALIAFQELGPAQVDKFIEWRFARFYSIKTKAMGGVNRTIFKN